MKFAHLADCHVGGWKDENLRELTIQAFERSINNCISEHIDFMLIAGDLFDSAMPSIDVLKRVTHSLRELKERDIPVYVIHGSHDYSVSGKTMLDVLEKAGLLTNVSKFREGKLRFTTDKTGVKITGLPGKRNSLEVEDFKKLDRASLEAEEGFKIFMFHTGIEEFKPTDLQKVKCTPMEYFPKGFNYYAGGHIHYVFEKEFYKGKLSFPGPLFPEDIRELETLKQGNYNIVEVEGGSILIKHYPVMLRETASFTFNVNDKDPEQIKNMILYTVSDVDNKIVILRLEGKMNGRPSHIDFKKIYSQLGIPYTILRNTSKLVSEEFDQTEINLGDVKDIETKILDSYKDKVDTDLVKNLVHSLDKEREEGEKVGDYEASIILEARKVLNLE